MKKDNEPTAQSTEERILAAAEHEFLQKGYAGARTIAIAEAAGVTHAMLHYYFRTKDKLFERIVEAKIKLVRDIVLESVGSDDIPLFEKIESVIGRHLEFIADNPDIPRFFFSEVFGQPERMQMVLDKVRNYAPLALFSLQHQIDECAAQGMCRRVDAAMLMLDIASLNVFPFMAAPMVNALLGGMMEDKAAFVAARKKENFETIMRKLKS